MQAVYVLKDVHQPLLGRDAIEALGLIKRLCAVSDNNDPKQQYSDLFTGLGCMASEYTIRLKPNAQPFAARASQPTATAEKRARQAQVIGCNQACRRADTVGRSNCCHPKEDFRH